MQIYVLRVTDQMLQPQTADTVGYGEWTQSRGLVVLANSAPEARSIAARQPYSGEWWNNHSLTTCELVAPEGEPRVLMENEPTG
jgi:hypothetical protein